MTEGTQTYFVHSFRNNSYLFSWNSSQKVFLCSEARELGKTRTS